MTDTFAPRYPVTPGDFTTVPFGQTPSQTVGPYLHIALPWPDGPDVVPVGTQGAIDVSVTIVDGGGTPVADAMIETWQADADGNFDARSSFRGFGRAVADPDGTATVHTIKPGSLPAENGAVEAPHMNVGVFARGMLERLITRIYFPDEAPANQADPVLNSLREKDRAKLIAAEVPGGVHLRIVVQDNDPDGDETPFFLL